MGVLIKQNVNSLYTSLSRLYNKLANAAFWTAQDKTDAAPTALNWNVPLKTLTITNNLEHSVVSYNGSPISGTVQVEAGETIDLLVSGDTGYAVSSVTASGTTIIDNQNGTFTVRVKVDNDMTVAISGTVVVVVSVTYNLTNCSAPSAPSMIQYGQGATIELEADSGYVMPSSLPNGAVNGVSVTSYTRNSNDKTKATLVIGSVSGNVTITINANQVTLFMKEMMYVVSYQNQMFALRTHQSSSTASNPITTKNRAVLICLRDDVDTPCAWNESTAEHVDLAAEAIYSAIPIPSGATKVSIKCNSNYYYFPGLVDASAAVLNSDATWVIGSTKTEFNLANYPTATHFAVTFKIGNAGTAEFSNETYESMGIEFNFE